MMSLTRAQKILIGVGIVLILVIVISVAGYFYFKSVTTKPNEIRFAMVERTGKQWYALSGHKVIKVESPFGMDSVNPIVRDVALPLKSSDVPVLVRVSNGSQLAVVRGSKKVFVPFLPNDTSYKVDITDRPDGMVAFSEYSIATSTGGVEGKWTLASYSLYPQGGLAPETKALLIGNGFSPRFVADGSLVAINSEGLVRVDPTSIGHSVLINRPNVQYGTAAISQDATRVLLPNSVAKTIDFFSIDAKHANSISYIGSIQGEKVVGAVPVAFLSDTSFVAEQAPGVFTVYDVGKTGIISKTHTATL